MMGGFSPCTWKSNNWMVLSSGALGCMLSEKKKKFDKKAVSFGQTNFTQVECALRFTMQDQGRTW